jgi:hypothetical protein
MHRARALLGWMDEEDARLALAGGQLEDATAPEYEARVRQKRLVASVRRPVLGTQGAVIDLPRSVRRATAAFEQTREGANLIAQGARPALVDLRRVCALMPVARTDLDLPEVDGNDLEKLAGLTLRPPVDARLDSDYDEEAKAWVVTTPGSDIQVVGRFQTPGQPGIVLGLVIARSPSFVQVARAGDRFVLISGYDSAITLLARGIHIIPALVQSRVLSSELPFGRSTLEREVVLGRRPPLLPDFLDDDVSAEVVARPVKRLLMVRASEAAHYIS